MVKRLAKLGLRVALFYAAGLLLILWDPFGIQDATSRYSVDVFHQIVGYRYPLGQPPRPEMPTDWISVVLVEDSTFEDVLEESWPIPYGQHARILRSILAREPAAVFVDFLFLDQNRDDPSLLQLKSVVNEYQRANIPLVFADAEFGLGAAGSTIQPLAELEGILLAQVAWRESTEIPSYYPVSVPRAAKTRSCRGVHLPSKEKKKNFLTPAFRLYDQLCTPPPKGCEPECHVSSCEDSTGKYDPDYMAGDECRTYCIFCRTPRWRRTKHPGASGHPLQPPMHIDWGSRPLAADGEGPYVPGGISEFLPLRALQRLFWESSAFQSTCYFHDTLLAECVLRPGNCDEESLSQQLRGRVVFYGARIAGIPDLVDSPTRALLPGVHVHAMAFDNLATYGSHYKGSWAPRFPGFEPDDAYQALALPFFALAFLVAAWLANNLLERRMNVAGAGLASAEKQGLSATCHSLFSFLAFIAAAIFVWIVSTLLYVYYGLPPLDWLGVAAAAALVRLVIPIQAKSLRGAMLMHTRFVNRIWWLTGVTDHLVPYEDFERFERPGGERNPGDHAEHLADSSDTAEEQYEERRNVEDHAA